MAVPVTGSLSQTGPINPDLWWVIAVLFALHMAMIIAFEIPDLESDRSAGKTVLAVRLGLSRTRRLITGFYAVGFGVATTGVVAVDGRFIWLLLGVPLAVATMVASRTDRFTVLTTSAVTAFGVSAAGGLIALL